MIKEKHEKSSDGVKEEPSSSDKDSPSSEVHAVNIKKEDDPTSSSVHIKKEPGRSVTKNGGIGIIGSTNIGSMHNNCTDLKTETEEPPPSSLDTTTTSTNLNLKTEVAELESDIPSDAFSSINLPSSVPLVQQPPDGVQPLASNVINKQPSNMEVQYMQQQSQIFVFSTTLANSGADEVVQGRYSSMIAFHCAQPGTKKYLEKNPLKVTQFNRQNPAQWLNNLAMMKNKGCNRSPGPPMGATKTQQHPPSLDNFLGPEGLDDMVGLGDGDLPWDQKNNHQLDALEGGVKVPDENLTPQQRQHREEQLATIRKMQQMLFPENQGHDGAAPGAPLGPGSNPDQQQQNMDMPPGQGGGGGPGNMMPINNQPPPQQQQQQQPPPPPSNMQQQQGHPNSGGGSIMHTTMDWHKMQQQYFDNKGKPLLPRGGLPPSSSCSSGPRLQGPPPPYHQTPRSASVPIALQSPSPASPNNPTSNLSLPSPRASSALNSPADSNRPFGLTRHMSTGQSPTQSQDSPSRHNHSNPGTPGSSHLSPSVNTNTADQQQAPPPTSHQSSADGLFGRTLQSIAQHSNSAVPTSGGGPPPSITKEPNLMPVPSPQQIQYLNTFEGQELIIQKQPNTSLKDGNMISPPILPTTMDSGFPGNHQDMSHNRISGPNTPTSVDVGGRFPGTPQDGCRFQIPSPHTPTGQQQLQDKPQPPRQHSGQGPGSASSGPGLSPQTSAGGPPLNDPVKNEMYHPSQSPHGMMDVPRFPGPSASPGSKMGGFVSPGGGKQPSPLDLPNYGCARNDNVPLNPNCTNTMSGNPKVSHFDPISSLAQMSQQLTNSVASSLNGQGNHPGHPGGGMMNFGSPSMHMMDMGGGGGGMHGGMQDMHNDHPGGPGMGPGMGGGMGGHLPPGMHGGPPGMHGFHPNSPMGGGGGGGPPIRSLSPKLQGAFPNHMPMPRMMGRPPGPPNPYNGANVQVKPNAPNTIQYMPAKSQVGNVPPGPRGPPSLDFLQRYANPLSNMDNKMPTQNLQYFPNCGPPGGPPMGPMGPMGGPMGGHMGGGGGGGHHHMDGGPDGSMGGGGGHGPMMVGGGGGPMGNGGPMGMGGGPNMGMSPGGGGGMMMMRGPPMRGCPPGMMRMPQMGGFNNGPPDGMFNVPGGGPPVNMSPNPNAQQMFVSGPKGSPMGIGGTPDASQPLPPSMGQNNSFKNSPFVGPTTADPNYAQQFHNFQQQLYATSTRSQMGGQAMGGPGPPHPQQPPYFNPK